MVAIQYPIQQLQLADLVEIVPIKMAAARPVREVEIPLANNVTSSIHESNVGGRFKLKQNMLQLLPTSKQLTGLSPEEPQQHL